MPAEPRVAVGRVGRPHGVAGAFVVDDASDEPARFEVGATLYVGDDEVRVEESKRAGGRVVIRVDRPLDRGTVLEVPLATLEPLEEEDTYYVFQLVGLDVVEEGGRSLGRVRDVATYAANDVLELEDGTLLPMVEACVREVDLDAQRILVAPGFADPE